MENKARKIQIHIRMPKRVVDTHAHKKVRAHKHAHEHDHVREAELLVHLRREEEHRREEERRYAEHLELIALAERKKEEELVRMRVEEMQKEQEEQERLARLQEEKDRAEDERILLVAQKRYEEEKRHATEPEHILPILTPPPPELSRMAEPLVPAKLLVPQKPIVKEGIILSALSVAYFCMEMGIEDGIPTYAGGLGILAGDTLRSSADLGLNTIGVTLLYRKGYFRQYFDDSGWQVEQQEEWDPVSTLILLPDIVDITLEGRTIFVRAWLYKVKGVGGHVNPLVFLDTDFSRNTSDDRQITSQLYAGDRALRLKQEAILGIAGIRMLKKIGATNIQKFHMNEGHSALLTIELYRQYRACDNPTLEVHERSVFTTHTPVAAGHDRFSRTLVMETLGEEYIPKEIIATIWENDELNMTHLGMMFSGYINGVAKRHGEVTRELFPGYHIESITNGVHAGKWVAPEIGMLLDRYISGWRSDAYNLRYAFLIPTDELWSAHQDVKSRLCAHVNTHAPGAQFDPGVFTMGFARRATAYKRGNMLFRDVERLKYIAGKHAGIQIVYSGKAHPDDREGKLIIQNIIHEMGALAGAKVRAVYLPDYNMELAQLLVSGVDMWMNTPVRPLEASGTSGMKAAMNGVPHFSTLDGWWLEGHIENVTGWAIGPHPESALYGGSDREDLEDLYTKLEYIILPKYEHDRHAWIKMMRSAIAINGSFFNTQRMVEQYVLGAYFK